MSRAISLVLLGLPVSLWYWRASLSADSTAREEHPVQVTGGQRRDPRGQLDRRRMRVGPVGVEAQLLGLVGARLGDVRPSVADVHAEQRRQPVQIPLAVLVPDVAALPADDDRDLGVLVGRHPGEVHPQVALGQLLERALLDCLLGARHPGSSNSFAVLYNGIAEARTEQLCGSEGPQVGG
jgi:hypothetical protein